MRHRDTQAQVLSLFITWAGLRFWKSLIDVGMQYSLVSKETLLIGTRMLLKSIVALVWTIVFAIFYSKRWAQRYHDLRWSREANRILVNYLKVSLVFIMPDLLTLLLFVLPWVRNFAEKRNWIICHVLTWWFRQLRLQFQLFASAIQFHLIPEELPFEVKGDLKAKVRDDVRHLQLRYGFGVYKKLSLLGLKQLGLLLYGMK